MNYSNKDRQSCHRGAARKPASGLLRLVLLFASCILVVQEASAHESRPALLQLTQVEGDTCQVIWRLPTIGGRAPNLALRLPADWNPVGTPVVRHLPEMQMTERTLRLPAGGLTGAEIEVLGLEQTIIDVLVTVQPTSGPAFRHILRPSEPRVTIPATPSLAAVTVAYLRMGFGHILSGLDHLAFVLALLLLISPGWKLVQAITAFTIAHSLTLFASVIGLATLPPGPVEAAIALSIVFLARELVLRDDGPSLTKARPWLVSFTFGLLHGFGFAGALEEVGLPHNEVPLALGAFNVGVEAGQLAFVVAVLALSRLARVLPERFTARSAPVLAYVIGTVAAFWWIQRLLG